MRFSAAMTAERLLPKWLAHRAEPVVTRIDALISSDSGSGAAGRVTLYAFLVRIANAVIAFASQVLLARWLGAFEYGIFVLVWVTMVIVGNLSCLGFHTSVIRFVPQYREAGKLAELRGILLTSRLFVLLASSAIAVAGAVGIWLFRGSIESYYIVPFYLGVVCLPMVALSDLLQGIARANAWASAALAPTYLIRPMLILVFMAGALALDYPPTALTAVLAAIAATYATTIYQLVNVTTRIDRKIEPGPRTVSLRFWIAVSLPIFLVESFFFLLTNADVLMVGMYLSPDDVAVYFATVKTLAIAHFVYFAVKAGVAQRYAHLAQEKDPGKLARFARETVNWTFFPTLLMAVAILVIGNPMLLLFGPGFDAGYPLLFVLILGVVARAAVGPAESLLTMTGHQNICAAAYAATLALNIGLNVILIPQFWLWGAAVATALAMTFEAAVLAFIVWRKQGIVMAVFLPASVTGEAD
ncbi:MAG: lipopolysaccharide biosynthesis protein [Rhizobiaceae bacterium]|nr:lipopolysaccharide biosynthesis protein [Rhizobiaceae bacterium]